MVHTNRLPLGEIPYTLQQPLKLAKVEIAACN